VFYSSRLLPSIEDESTSVLLCKTSVIGFVVTVAIIMCGYILAVVCID